MARGREKKKKNYVSPFGDASGKKISVLLSASVERFGVSRMRDFWYLNVIDNACSPLHCSETEHRYFRAS